MTERKIKRRTGMLIGWLLWGILGCSVLVPASEQHLQEAVEPVMVELEDGEYAVSVDLTGGSGKAFVSSPTLLVIEDGRAYAHLTWSSSNYDYMIVGNEKYLNQSEEGAASTFLIPVVGFDEEMPVIADTLAMGSPREIKYQLTFYGESIGSKGQLPQEAAKRVVMVAFAIIIGGGILNHYVKKKRLDY